jgi:hypothetical protein
MSQRPRPSLSAPRFRCAARGPWHGTQRQRTGNAGRQGKAWALVSLALGLSSNPRVDETVVGDKIGNVEGHERSITSGQ